MFCHVFLGGAAVHPATYKVCTLIEDTNHVGAILLAHTQRQPALTVALLCLLQTEFNGSFCQVLERQKQVCWPCFERLRQDLWVEAP